MNLDMRKTKIPGWYEFNRIACPICGHCGGCMQHKDGDKVACIRVPSDQHFSKNSSLPSYLHYLKGKKKRRKIKDNTGTLFKGEKKRSDHELHEVYQSMINALELKDSHYEHLVSESRQLTDQQIMDREYRSFPEKPWNIAKYIEEELNVDNFVGIPGFYEATGPNGSYWSIAGRDGILIPFRNHKNEFVGFQYRLDNPPNDVKIEQRVEGLRASVIQQPNLVQVSFEGEILFEKEMELDKAETIFLDPNATSKNNILGWVTLKKGNRYYWLSSANKPRGTSAGEPAPIHISVPTSRLKQWKVGESLQTQKIWISEGSLKTDIASDLLPKIFEPEELELYGDIFLALPGVNAWKLCLPVLKEMGVEQINLCFDADVVNNIQVKAILLESIREFKKEKFHVNMVIWNTKDGKGIDDLLLQNKKPQIQNLY